MFSFAAAVLSNSSSLWIVFSTSFAMLVGYIAMLATIARSARPRPLNMNYMGAPLSAQFANQRIASS